MKQYFFSLLLMILSAIQLSAQVPTAILPEFQFSRLDQSAFTNKELPQGKTLFFVFFDPGCEHCQRTIKYIDKHCPLLNKTCMYLVSMDKTEKIAQFIATYGAHLRGRKNVLILQDRLYQFITKFKPKKYPSMFLYSAKKKLLDYSDDETKVPRFIDAINKKGK